MKKKFLRHKKGYDPEWIRIIARFLLTIEKEDKSEAYKKKLLDLFFEYRQEGMESKKTWKKARLVIDCFKI